MSDWETCEIGKYVEVQNGYAFKSKDFCEDNGVPVVKIKNVASGKLDMDDAQFYQLPIDDLERYILKKDDILIAMTGSHVNQPSSMVGRIARYSLSEIALLIEEQNAITAVLASLDDKIDLLHRQNKTLEALAQTLFRHWFIDGDDDWEDGVIPDEFDFTMGLSPPGSSYNENGTGTPMFQGNADFSFRFPENRVYTTDPRRFAEKYDTLISVRALVGDQNMASEKCCIGRGVAAFRYKENPSYYTYAYFKLHSLMDEIKQFNDEGTVFGSISKRDFMSFEITVPPKDVVERFQTTVKPIDDKVIANCNQIKTLERLRDTLLPKLMSGEVRVCL